VPFHRPDFHKYPRLLVNTDTWRLQDHPLPASLRSLQLGMDPESMAHHAALPRLTSLWSEDRSGVPVGNFDMLRVSERASRSALRHRLDEHREGEAG